MFLDVTQMSAQRTVVEIATAVVLKHHTPENIGHRLEFSLLRFIYPISEGILDIASVLGRWIRTVKFSISDW